MIDDAVDDNERLMIDYALKKYDWIKQKAVQVLGLSRHVLNRKLNELRIT